MNEYKIKFSAGLNAEQRKALIWKIEGDYLNSTMGVDEPKDYFVRLAIKFYTRNEYSLEDIVEQYRTHRRTARRSLMRIFSIRQEDSALLAAS